jgi:hypothetical protein
MRRLYVPLHPAAFLTALGTTYYLPCGMSPPAHFPKPKGNNGSGARRNGICIWNLAQHRFGVRMRYRRDKLSDHRIVQAQNQACTDIPIADVLYCFSRALFVTYIKQVIDKVHSSTHSDPAAFCTTRAL